MSHRPLLAVLSRPSRPARTASRAAPLPSPWPPLARKYAQAQLFWNPVITAGAVLWLGGGSFWRQFPRAWLIAAVASSVSFIPVAIGLALDRRALARGRRSAPRGKIWYFGVALLSLPAGVLLASHATELVFDERVLDGARDYRFGVFLGTLLAALFFAVQLLAEARQAALAAELRAERAERLEVEAQLAALSARLNPHLLFNALNTIAALIPMDASRAERTVLRLAEMYRGLLSASRLREHALEQELEICRAYLDVERARFAERLVVAIEIEAGLDPQSALVPVLILQPLVENAVKHGLEGRRLGGTLRIEARRSPEALELAVVDDGVGLGHSSRSGPGLGIETTRERLRLRYGAAAALELSSPAGGGTRAVLRLPFVDA